MPRGHFLDPGTSDGKVAISVTCLPGITCQTDKARYLFALVRPNNNIRHDYSEIIRPIQTYIEVLTQHSKLSLECAKDLVLCLFAAWNIDPILSMRGNIDHLMKFGMCESVNWLEKKGT